MSEPSKNSVLVVDDQNSNIMALTQILNPDYKVYAAKNGLNAIAAAEKHLPDIILLDIMMPEMDGYAVITALKNSEKTKNIPVIFITGLSKPDDEEKGLTLGAADYVTKPFSPSIVKLRIQNQIKMLDQLRIIERLSMLDQLTEIPNRRSFDNQLHLEWRKAAREQQPVSVLFLDVDKFKNYNDSFGHQQGDVALQTIAATLTHTLKRAGDFAARWGGEEFAVLLPNTSLSGSLEIAEQIRKCVQATEIPCPDKAAAYVTVSIGVNTQEYGQDGTMEEFISGADKGLYQAKEDGRNRVCHFKNINE
ncbi:MAG: diguanylate cyclase [Oscillospiraceae bacterium]|jgi:diguanylate cyclase (GGDEF)-like protein|nr:diguanylate cyclase [Oscillospiraceae bacterium]